MSTSNNSFYTFIVVFIEYSCDYIYKIVSIEIFDSIARSRINILYCKVIDIISLIIEEIVLFLIINA